MNHITSFQFLRFFAFLLIFLFHSNGFAFLPNPGGGAAASAVSFFILLSGFLSGYSSADKTITCNINEIFNYVRKKVRKFYPLYIGTTAVTILYCGLKSYIAAGNTEAVFALLIQLIKNIFLIQSWFPTGYFLFNSVSWFLSTMMFLYVCKVPLTYFVSKLNSLRVGKVLLLGLLIVINLIIIGYTYWIGSTDLSTEFYLYIFPPARFLEFTSGILCGFLMHACRTHIASNRLLCTVFEIFSLVVWFYAYQTQLFEWECRALRWLLPNLLILCAFSLNNGVLSGVFSLKWAKHLGDISFECYLLHQVILTLCSYAVGYLAPLIDKIFYTESLFMVKNALLQIGCLFITLLLSHFIYAFRQKR